MKLAWASLVLGPFAETKGPRPPGRTPAEDKTSTTKKAADERGVSNVLEQHVF